MFPRSVRRWHGARSCTDIESTVQYVVRQRSAGWERSFGVAKRLIGKNAYQKHALQKKTTRIALQIVFARSGNHRCWKISRSVTSRLATQIQRVWWRCECVRTQLISIRSYAIEWKGPVTMRCPAAGSWTRPCIMPAKFGAALLLLQLLFTSAHVPIRQCPTKCTCDVWLLQRRANCTSVHTHSVYLGVSDDVQVLNLFNNSITSLSNHELMVSYRLPICLILSSFFHFLYFHFWFFWF